MSGEPADRLLLEHRRFVPRAPDRVVARSRRATTRAVATNSSRTSIGEASPDVMSLPPSRYAGCPHGRSTTYLSRSSTRLRATGVDRRTLRRQIDDGTVSRCIPSRRPPAASTPARGGSAIADLAAAGHTVEDDPNRAPRPTRRADAGRAPRSRSRRCAPSSPRSTRTSAWSQKPCRNERSAAAPGRAVSRRAAIANVGARAPTMHATVDPYEPGSRSAQARGAMAALTRTRSG